MKHPDHKIYQKSDNENNERVANHTQQEELFTPQKSLENSTPSYSKGS